MKKKTLQIILFVMICSLLMSSSAIAAVPETMDPMASYYINATNASVSARGGGKIYVDFSITATGYMTRLGAMTVEIFRDDGTCVKSCNYTEEAYGHFMGYNDYIHRSGIEYYGMPGNTYHAVVYFYAGNSSGSDGDTYVTLPTTA